MKGASRDEADRAFAAAVARAGGGPPYVDLADGMSVKRELERGVSSDLAALHVMSWNPDDRKLRQVAFPFWFVRMKTTDSVNLGTFAAALTGDWENLDIGVTVEDLERLGPALVIDHSQEGGGRIVLWTEGR